MIKLRRLAALALALSVSLSARERDQGYVETNLIANSADYHPRIVDPKMIDAWGIALRPPGAGGHIWISNAASGTSSEYIGDVKGNPLHQDGLKTVVLAPPRFTDHGYAFVTGQSYNSASDLPGQPVEFPVSGDAYNLKASPPEPVRGGYSGSAKFVFVTEDGCINAWSSGTAVAMAVAPVVIDCSKTAPHLPDRLNCVFTGCALTNNASGSEAYTRLGGNLLFAADIRNNVIRVYDHAWTDVTPRHRFETPVSVGRFHPFNVLDLGGHLFVAYADFDPASDEGQEQIVGAGRGHVVEYNEDGTLALDFQDKGVLNAPWGMALAPATFGEFANDLLVANFGDGTIAAFDPKTGGFGGYLRGVDTKIVSIDGVWGLAFGNGVSLGDAGSLYFTAGPNSENDGLFGRLNTVADQFKLP